MDWPFPAVDLDPIWRPYLPLLVGNAEPQLAPLYYCARSASSQTWAQAQLQERTINQTLWLVDQQAQGLGRTGQHWYSPANKGLYMTQWLRMSPDCHPAGFSLVAAMGVCYLCATLGVTAIDWKWPNDIVIQWHKIAGLLLWYQASPSPGGLLLGIGINGHPLGNAQLLAASPTNLPATDLTTWCNPASRQILQQPGWQMILGYHLAGIMGRLAHAYQQSGLQPFLPLLEHFDCLRGRSIQAEGPEGTMKGTAAGLGPKGELLVATANGVLSCHAGVIKSIRPQAEKDRIDTSAKER